MGRRLDVCFDVYRNGARFKPSSLPRIDPWKATSDELAVEWRKQWQPGQELRVQFLDGSSALHERVKEYASAWLEHANLRFKFGKFADAEIRITFEGDGYWSVIGTDAMSEPIGEPTMQLGGFTATSDAVELRRTVLHEFGHAIGCVHEQASPAFSIPWDEEKVYAYYAKWQGWDRETTYQNVIVRYSQADTRYTQHDPTSIMQYPVQKELTKGGFEIGWNNNLSALDRAFIAKMYPAQANASP
jgi:hypothetical protein